MQKKIVSISPPKNLLEERKWFLAVAYFEATKSVFSKSHENNTFSITTAVRWIPEVTEGFINKLNEI